MENGLNGNERLWIDQVWKSNYISNSIVRSICYYKRTTTSRLDVKNNRSQREKFFLRQLFYFWKHVVFFISSSPICFTKEFCILHICDFFHGQFLLHWILHWMKLFLDNNILMQMCLSLISFKIQTSVAHGVMNVVIFKNFSLNLVCDCCSFWWLQCFNITMILRIVIRRLYLDKRCFFYSQYSLSFCIFLTNMRGEESVNRHAVKARRFSWEGYCHFTEGLVEDNFLDQGGTNPLTQ